MPKLMAIFGPDGEDFVSGGDPVQAKNNAVEFATEAKTKHSISTDSSKPSLATLIVGEEQWPFPVPLVKKNGKWYFDSKAGRQTILFRRIGANELDAITVCRGYVAAQGSTHRRFTTTPASTNTRRRSSAVPASRTACTGRIRTELRQDQSEILWPRRSRRATPSAKGLSRLLLQNPEGPGPEGPDGAINYVIEGIMIGGFALVAVPAEYRVTGVKHLHREL